MKTYEIEYATTDSLSGYVDIKTKTMEAESKTDAIARLKEMYCPFSDIDVYSVVESV